MITISVIEFFPSDSEPDYEFEKNLQDADSMEKEVAEFECEVNDDEAVVQWFREDKVSIKHLLCSYLSSYKWASKQASKQVRNCMQIDA